MSDELTTDQKRELLGKTGFRSGGFKPAEEAPPEPSSVTTPEAEITNEELAAAEMAADVNTANDRAAFLDLNLPGAPKEESVTDTDTPAPPAATEPKGGKIRIGTRSFDSQEEAYAYAQELQEQRIADDAFRQGIEAARSGSQSNTPVPTVTPEPEEVPDYYYTDPARYQREMREKVKTEAIQAITQQQQAAARSQATMAQFYKDFPDLVGDEDVVDMFIKRDWETIKGLDTKVGLKLVADRTRGWLEEKVNKRLPATELKRTTGTVSTGTSKTVTAKKPDDKPLNFISQQRSLKTPQGRAAARKRLGL